MDIPDNPNLWCRGRHTLWLHESAKASPVAVPVADCDMVVFGQHMHTGFGYTMLQIYVLSRDYQGPPSSK